MFYGDDISTASESSYCCSCSSYDEFEEDQISDLRWSFEFAVTFLVFVVSLRDSGHSFDPLCD
jgi:hypothetical protein